MGRTISAKKEGKERFPFFGKDAYRGEKKGRNGRGSKNKDQKTTDGTENNDLASLKENCW